MLWLTVAVVVYGLMLVAGGVAGFTAAHSMTSLITGAGSGILCLIGAIWAQKNQSLGYGLVAVVSLAVLVFFGHKAATSGWPMRSVGIAATSLLMFLLLTFGHFLARRPS
ncbi:MAG: TMEM14 family protein [Fimbriimonas ginsengisoli]|uniref:TMEM14 family protein n=1 Tax=Fimbriimonas ginsengisoli TaxID=1005039 RepID=A0A931LTC8_FIMGI|nr:TMEM14 family protein [Fimbriimonas ginsengisoli]MBI3721657.1 TMEM14 family protein [Fimbriimonas ginsengisoli]